MFGKMKADEIPPEILAQREHLTMRNYMRDVILGSNDGLVSIFALVLGVAGSGFIARDIFLAGLAGTIAGAISMAIGEYLSTKSQEQVFDSEKELELLHIRHDFESEKQELYDIYASKGFTGDLLERIVDHLVSNEDVMLEEMMTEEFGVLEDERRTPWIAAMLSGTSFTVGSLPSFLPFLFVATVLSGLLISGVLSLLSLFIVGAMKGYITKFNIYKLGLENLLLGALGGIVTYSIGALVGGTV